MIFPSLDGMRRCSLKIRRAAKDACLIQELSFGVSKEMDKNDKWACFFVVLFHEQYVDLANEFWGFMGDGISSRHADFCYERFSFMNSVSLDISLQTHAKPQNGQISPLLPWQHSDSETKDKIKALIAKLVSSDKPGQRPVEPRDVFLYPKGMSAIGKVARRLVPESTHSSEAVVFGYGIFLFCMKSRLTCP